MEVLHQPAKFKKNCMSEILSRGHFLFPTKSEFLELWGLVHAVPLIIGPNGRTNLIEDVMLYSARIEIFVFTAVRPS